MIPSPLLSDPQQMSGAERKFEVARILAVAYLRRLARRNDLALPRGSEPSCAAVDGGERRRAASRATGCEVRR